MITIQNYVQAESLEQAWQLNQKRSARVLGGMLWLKMGKNTVGTAIDLCRLGLDTIEERADEFVVGAMVTLRQLEQHPGLNACTRGAVAKALQPIVGVPQPGDRRRQYLGTFRIFGRAHAVPGTGR